MIAALIASLIVNVIFLIVIVKAHNDERALIESRGNLNERFSKMRDYRDQEKAEKNIAFKNNETLTIKVNSLLKENRLLKEKPVEKAVVKTKTPGDALNRPRKTPTKKTPASKTKTK